MRFTQRFTKYVHLLCIVSLLAALPLVVEPSLTVQADASTCKGSWVILAILSGGTNDTETFPGALYTVDAATNTLYGPFLQGQLGPASGNLLDVAVTPDCRTALVSNFLNSTVFFVDVSDPTDLRLLGSLNVTFSAEDIAITPDGRFALVTDGGLASKLASINISARTLVEVEDLGDKDAQAVTSAPDGTVIVADYLNSSLHTLTIDSSGNLTPALSYNIPLFSKGGKNFTDMPINVAVAPDGQTVLVVSSSTDHMTIYQVTGPGTLAYAGRVFGLPPFWDNATLNWHGGQQSVAFSANGTQAYVITNGLYDPAENVTLSNQISVLDITGPGSVSLRISGAAPLMNNNTGQFYGVDVLDVTCDKLYVGNPTGSWGVTYLTVVDLNDFSVTAIPVGEFEGAIPTGVAVLPYAPLFVGGVIVPVDNSELLAPSLGLAVVMILSMAALYLKNIVAQARLSSSSDRDMREPSEGFD